MPQPDRPAEVESQPTAPTASAIKQIAHGVYLQLFIGGGMLAIAAIGVDTKPLFDGPLACGALLIGLGANSLTYINRYKKSLGGVGPART